MAKNVVVYFSKKASKPGESQWPKPNLTCCLCVTFVMALAFQRVTVNTKPSSGRKKRWKPKVYVDQLMTMKSFCQPCQLKNICLCPSYPVECWVTKQRGRKPDSVNENSCFPKFQFECQRACLSAVAGFQLFSGSRRQVLMEVNIQTSHSETEKDGDWRRHACTQSRQFIAPWLGGTTDNDSLFTLSHLEQNIKTRYKPVLQLLFFCRLQFFQELCFLQIWILTKVQHQRLSSAMIFPAKKNPIIPPGEEHLPSLSSGLKINNMAVLQKFGFGVTLQARRWLLDQRLGIYRFTDLDQLKLYRF